MNIVPACTNWETHIGPHFAQQWQYLSRWHTNFTQIQSFHWLVGLLHPTDRTKLLNQMGTEFKAAATSIGPFKKIVWDWVLSSEGLRVPCNLVFGEVPGCGLISWYQILKPTACWLDCHDFWTKRWCALIILHTTCKSCRKKQCVVNYGSTIVYGEGESGTLYSFFTGLLLKRPWNCSVSSCSIKYLSVTKSISCSWHLKAIKFLEPSHVFLWQHKIVKHDIHTQLRVNDLHERDNVCDNLPWTLEITLIFTTQNQKIVWR